MKASRWTALVLLLGLVAAQRDPPMKDGIVKTSVPEASTTDRLLERTHDNPAPGRGRFLARMEWFNGKEPRPAPIPSEIFEADNRTVEWTEAKPVLAAPHVQRNNAHLAAALVSAFSKQTDLAGRRYKRPVREYLNFLKTHQNYRTELRKMFRHLDRNGDGALDNAELQEAVNRGLLSEFGAATLKTWDINFSKLVSWKEFQFGPLFIMQLKVNAPLLAKFKRSPVTNSFAVSTFFRTMFRMYEREYPAALGLIEEEVTVTDEENVATREAALAEDAAAKAAHEVMAVLSHPGALLELHSASTAAAKAKALEKVVAKAQATALSHLGISRAEAESTGIFDSIKRSMDGAVQKLSRLVKKSVAKVARPVAAAIAPSTIDPRPRSKFGIPSELDETCVMCQYVLQRTEKELNMKVVDDVTAFDDITRKQTAPTGGIPGLEQTSGRSTGTRRRSDRIIEERGMRSPVRMVREVMEVLFRRICGNSLPQLFRGACQNLWEGRHRLAKGMAFKVDSASNCQLQLFCGPRTYFASENSVHSPFESEVLNGARGFCGLLGGPNERDFVEALCPSPPAPKKSKMRRL